MPNFFAKFSTAAGKGTCTAIDRAAAATCEHYEAGQDGWCRHTIRPKFGKAPAAITGECYSDRAARAPKEKK